MPAATPRRRILRIVTLVAIAFAANASAADAAPEYRYHGVPWPNGVVKYYNAAPSQGWALWQAVAAWNRSGAKVRFVATSRRNAQLIIRHDPSVASCQQARATVGFVRTAHVLIYPRNDASSACSKYRAARSLAHELGHVLGLKHENGGCAAMNSAGSYMGGSMCPNTNLGEWRCQLLERDDVAGVVAIYGGSPRPEKRASPMCPLYKPIAPPAMASASYRPEYRGVMLQFRRAPDPAMPAFLKPLAADRQRGYGYLAARTRAHTSDDRHSPAATVASRNRGVLAARRSATAREVLLRRLVDRRVWWSQRPRSDDLDRRSAASRSVATPTPH